MWFKYSYHFLLGTREDSFYFVLYSNFSGSGFVRLNQTVNNFLAFWVSGRPSSMTMGLIWLFFPQRPENFNWLFFSFLGSGSSLVSFAFHFRFHNLFEYLSFRGRGTEINIWTLKEFNPSLIRNCWKISVALAQISLELGA